MNQTTFLYGQLRSESSETLIKWIDKLRNIRTRFKDSGYRVPDLDKILIESMRSREADEKDYECYLDEILKEAAWLPRGLWYHQTRNTLLPSKRSSYLDLLQTRIEANVFDCFKNKTLHAILDPNFMLYADLVGFDNKAWKTHLEAIRQQKQCEIEQFRERIETLSPPKRIVNLNNIVKLVQSIANEQRLQCFLVEGGHNPRVILRTEIAENLSMYLEWSDMLVLRKWGDLQFKFIVQESDRPIWKKDDFRSIPFAAGFGGLIPGGDYYSSQNEGWDGIVLGFLANIEFLKCCSVSCP
jgi:hypothetical protein